MRFIEALFGKQGPTALAFGLGIVCGVLGGLSIAQKMQHHSLSEVCK